MKRNKCIIIAVVAIVMICLMVLCACTEVKCNHVASEWIIEKEAKCNEQGLRYIECVLCHERLKEESFDGEHPWSDENIIDTPPTCTKDGKQHKVCTVCSTAIKEEIIHRTGHASSDWIIDSEATCEHEGTMHQECISCGITLEAYITPKTSHTDSDWIINSEATCERDGIMHKECISCGITITTSKIGAVGHDLHEQPPKKVDEKWIIETVCKTCNEIIATKEVETLAITSISKGTSNFTASGIVISKSVFISVSCTGGYGELSYKYDVYKNGILVNYLCQSWTTSNEFGLSTKMAPKIFLNIA